VIDLRLMRGVLVDPARRTAVAALADQGHEHVGLDAESFSQVEHRGDVVLNEPFAVSAPMPEAIGVSRLVPSISAS
jgi:hypothetical protein